MYAVQPVRYAPIFRKKNLPASSGLRLLSLIRIQYIYIYRATWRRIFLVSNRNFSSYREARDTVFHFAASRYLVGTASTEQFLVPVFLLRPLPAQLSRIISCSKHDITAIIHAFPDEDSRSCKLSGCVLINGKSADCQLQTGRSISIW
jgi:hypothetical protein